MENRNKEQSFIQLIQMHMQAEGIDPATVILEEENDNKGQVRLQAGLDLVICGAAGLYSSAMIAAEHKEELMNRYPESFIDAAAGMWPYSQECLDAAASAIATESSKIKCIQRAGWGGVFAALWNLAAACKVGLVVDLHHIPMKQHTVEVCEFFDLNPYVLDARDTMIIACDNSHGLLEKLDQCGMKAAWVGNITDNNDRIIRYDDKVRYLEPPKRMKAGQMPLDFHEGICKR